MSRKGPSSTRPAPGASVRSADGPPTIAGARRLSAQGTEPVPEKPVAKLRLENRSSGKHVTVVDGLPDNREFVEALARELKKACGTGGAVAAGMIELQGDQRERLRDLLAKKGMTVKG